MAVPKKRTSRSKKKIRKTIWREKANQAVSFVLLSDLLPHTKVHNNCMVWSK